MKRYGALLLLIALPVLGGQDLDRSRKSAEEIQLDPVLRGILWSLFKKSDYGFSDFESAAFLIRTPSGGLSFVPWLRSEFRNEARWVGPFPSGTIAIVHTQQSLSPTVTSRRQHRSSDRTSRLRDHVVAHRENNGRKGSDCR